MGKEDFNANKSENMPVAVKTQDAKPTAEVFTKAFQDKNAEAMISSIGSCEAGTITKDMVSEMIGGMGGTKALLDNFSKLKDVNSQSLAEMIIDSGKCTKSLFDNEVSYSKNKKELSSVENDMSARRKVADTKSGDLEQINRNLSVDESYQKLKAKEQVLEGKIKEGETFIMGLDKNKLLTRCLDVPNFFTPDKLKFFCAQTEGNQAARGVEDTLIQIVEKNNYGPANLGALLSAAEDASFGPHLLEALKKAGKEDLIVSFGKKFTEKPAV